MLSLQQIEQDLTIAIKAKDQISVDVLRGLKTRLTNERIAKGRDLSDEEILALLKSEVKKRKEAAEAFKAGARAELAEKELKESAFLEKYLPAQMSEGDITAAIDAGILENGFTAKDFGKAMGMLKSKLGQAADGALLAKILKEKLK